MFYVDLMAPADRDDVRDALAEVAEHTSLLRVLGSYRVGRRAGLTDRLPGAGPAAASMGRMAATRPVVTPRVAVALAARGDARGGARRCCRASFGGGGDEGVRSGASLPPPGDVKTPPPANHAIRRAHDVPRQRVPVVLRRGARPAGPRRSAGVSRPRRCA